MRFSALPLIDLSDWGRISRAIVAFILLSIIYLLFTSPSVFAQNTVYHETVVGDGKSIQEKSIPFAPNLDDNVPKTQSAYIQSMVIDLMVAATCQISGVNPIGGDQKCLGINPATGKLGMVEDGGGAIGIVQNLIVLTYTPPASTAQYVNYLAGNFGITKPTYAEHESGHEEGEVYRSPCYAGINGVGFCGIQPIVKAWVAMRNIAYLLMILLFAVIGLSIMLRVRIDPRTVMTIQNQIPKIIVGLIMITFSFAIAGFLIDIMYLSVYVVGRVFVDLSVSIGPGQGITNFGEVATSGSPFDAINRLWDRGFWELALNGTKTVNGLVTNIADINLSPNIGMLVTDTLGFGVGLVLGIFTFLVIVIALLWISVRLFIILIVAYISILLDIIFAPFWFLLGLVPGSTVGAGAWFRDIVANLAVYPTAIAMFLLARIFFDLAKGLGVEGALFTPPLTGGTGSGNSAEIFAGLIALGFLFLTPNVMNYAKNALKAPKGGLGNVLQPAGVGAGVVTGSIKGAAQTTVASKEVRMSKVSPGGQVSYGRTGALRGFMGRALR